MHFTRASVYNIQWKRILSLPFIVKSHNNTDEKIGEIKNAYFKPRTG